MWEAEKFCVAETGGPWSTAGKRKPQHRAPFEHTFPPSGTKVRSGGMERGTGQPGVWAPLPSGARPEGWAKGAGAQTRPREQL